MNEDTKAQIQAFKKAMQEKSQKVHTKLGIQVGKAVNLVRNTAIEGMTSTQTDPMKAYKRQKGRKIHYASADGEYPAVDSGALRQSVTTSVEYTDTGVQGEVGTNLLYGRFLETGTSKMRARPWLGPSVAKNQEAIRQLLNDAMRDE